MLQEVRSRLAELGAVSQHRDVFGFSVIATGLLAVLCSLHADIVTTQAILDTLLYLYLTRLVPCVLLHCPLPFLMFFYRLTDSLISLRKSLTCTVLCVGASGRKASAPCPGKIGLVSIAAPIFVLVVWDG